MKLRYLPLLFLLATTLSAQEVRMAENWHFGPGLNVIFQDGVPTLGPGSAMLGFEGVVSLSDTNGTLLFYSNGGGRPLLVAAPITTSNNSGFIWNRNDEVMHDMRGGEGGGVSALQTSIALPDPAGTEGSYYLFTMEEAEFTAPGGPPSEPRGRGLKYFTIDMTLNGGLGDEVLTNQDVYIPTFEGLDATRMADGGGYWIICNDNEVGGEFAVVPFTAAGVGTPDLQVVTPGSIPRGPLYFSPDGSYLYTRNTLYNFDNATGQVGSIIREIPGIVNRTAAYTSDSRYLYAFERQPIGQVVVRYRLPDGQREEIGLLPSPTDDVALAPGNVQLGPDGNLYFVELRNQLGGPRSWLSRITCPASNLPTVESFLLEFTDQVSRSGSEFAAGYLPQFDDGIFQAIATVDTLRLDTLPLTICQTETTTLRRRRANGGTVTWSTGEVGDTIRVNAPGVYTATYANACGSVIVDAQRVEQPRVEDLEIVLLDQTRISCDSFNNLITVRQLREPGFSLLGGGIVFPAQPGRPTEQSRRFQAGDTVSVRTAAGPGTFLLLPFLERDPTDAVCTGAQPLTLDFVANPPEDDFSVAVVASEELCGGEEATFVVRGDTGRIAGLEWSVAGEMNGDSLTVVLDAAADYFVDITDTCDLVQRVELSRTVAEFCNCEYAIPEIISPNGDGTNDVFRVFSGCPLENYGVVIFNRWGDAVFESSDPDEAWNGDNPGGEPANPDTYLYRATFRLPGEEDNIAEEGQFILVR